MRTPITLRIKFKSAGLAQFIERYSVDVSQSGIFIRTKEPLKVGTALKFEFQLQDTSSLIVGEGTVVWTREHDPARTGMAPGMGVRFDSLTEVSRRVLDHILAEKARRGEGALESRFDAGVRASQFVSGTTSGERDTNTPLPPPRPGLDERVSAFNVEESTRVMGTSQARDLVESMREPWADQPTVANASAVAALAATLGPGALEVGNDFDFRPPAAPRHDAVPEPLPREETPGPRRSADSLDRLTPTTDQMAELGAAMNALEAPGIPAPLSFRTTTDVAGAVPPPRLDVRPLPLPLPPPLDPPESTPFEVPIETFDVVDETEATSTPPVADPTDAAPGLREPGFAEIHQPAIAEASDPPPITSAAMLFDDHLPLATDEGAMPLAIGVSGRVIEESSPVSPPPPPIALPVRPPPPPRRGFPFVSVAIAIVVLGGVGAVWFTYKAAPPGDGARPVAKRPSPSPATLATTGTKPAPVMPRAPAGLEIEAYSTPAGATLTVDGKPIAEVTPTRIAGLEAGKSYPVVVTLKGYRTVRQNWQVAAGKPLRVTLVALDKFVELTSDPPGSDVFLDGKNAGVAGRKPLRIKLGTTLGKGRVLTISHAGFQSDQRTLTDDAAFSADGDRQVLVVAANLVKSVPAAPAPRDLAPAKSENVGARRTERPAPPTSRHAAPKKRIDRPAASYVAPVVKSKDREATPHREMSDVPPPPKPTRVETDTPVEKPMPQEPSATAKKMAPSDHPASETPPRKPPEKPPADESDPAIKVPAWMKSKATESGK